MISRPFDPGPVPKGYLTQIRNVGLLPGEWVNHVFCPDRGLVPEPPGAGQALVATNRRILAFNLGEQKSDTFIAPLDDLRGVSLNPGMRNPGSVLQGTLLILGAMFIYLVLAYWLTGTFEGPNVPFINIDLGALGGFGGGGVRRGVHRPTILHPAMGDGHVSRGQLVLHVSVFGRRSKP